jgi:hypothetical protein
LINLSPICWCKQPSCWMLLLPRKSLISFPMNCSPT